MSPCNPDGITDAYAAGIRLFFTGYETEQCGFTGAVCTDDADDCSGRYGKIEIFKEKFAVVAFCDTPGFHHDIPQPGAWWNPEFHIPGFLLGFAGTQRFEPFQAGFGAQAFLGSGLSHPLEFLFQCLLALGFTLTFEAEPLFLLGEP